MKLLYVVANPKLDQDSVSRTLGQKFLEKFKEKHFDVEVTTIDLFKEELPDVDTDVTNAWTKLMSGKESELTEVEQTKLKIRNEVIEKFMQSDVIVYVTPMWEFSYPSVIKKFLDTVTAVHKTFKYSPEGIPLGLLGEDNKKVIHIQASGGVYSSEVDPNLATIPTLKMAKNYGNEHLEANMRFLGIDTYYHIYASGQNMPDLKDSKLKEATEKIVEVIEKI